MASSLHGPWRYSRKESTVCAKPPRNWPTPRHVYSASWNEPMDPSISSTPLHEGTRLGWSTDRVAIDRALENICDRYAATLGLPVADAVRYSLLGGGKRLRGLLFLAAYRTAGGSADASELAAAIEVVHAYSLVHDDLPCMDDDDM